MLDRFKGIRRAAAPRSGPGLRSGPGAGSSTTVRSIRCVRPVVAQPAAELARALVDWG